MISLCDCVRSVLEGLGVAVWYFYPQNWMVKPVISWRESGNREFAQADGREHLAELEYSVDIWAEGPAEAAEIGARVDAAMTAMRFRREYSADLFDAKVGCHHRSVRYRCVADAAGRIYQ